ncbi:ABC transporter permease subunit [Oscillospiraceae bacterium 50-16]|nr:ABC transporter permease subunit [Lawsonibacter sp.]
MGWANPLKKLLYALPAPAFWLGVWQGCALLVDRSVGGRGNELLLPYPASVLRALAGLAGTEEFWAAVLASLGRITLGLAGGLCLGGLLAVLTCASPWADRLLSPAVRVVRAAPVASFILLVLLWTGRAAVPGVIAALMVIPVVWDSLSQGIRAVDKGLLELARVCRFSPGKTAVLIYLPSLRPQLLAALTTAAGLAWKSGVAAEVLCLPEPALGQRIYYAKYNLEIPELFAWTAVTAGLSMLLERLLRVCVARWGRGWSE